MGISKIKMPKNCTGRNEDEELTLGLKKKNRDLDFSVITSIFAQNFFPFIIETMCRNDRTYLYILCWYDKCSNRVLERFRALFSILKWGYDVWIIFRENWHGLWTKHQSHLLLESFQCMIWWIFYIWKQWNFQRNWYNLN